MQGSAPSRSSTDVDLHYVSPTTTTISWPHAAACTQPEGGRLCIVIADILVVGKRHIRAVGAAIPRATSAKITHATVATTEVASGRKNVVLRAGTKGIAATSGRFQVRFAPGALNDRALVAGQKTTGRMITMVPVMSPFGSSRGVRVWHGHLGVANVVLIHCHVLIVSRIQVRVWRGLPWR